MKKLLFFLFVFFLACQLQAQPSGCTFDQPAITINFGSGNVHDLNTAALSNYGRVAGTCPTDGYYAYTSFTSNCFKGDWFNLPEDHTPGDKAGNMMLVNASYNSGMFLMTTIKGLKSNTTYEFAVCLMNVCRITDKCPFPLLPNIDIRLQTPAGKTIAQFRTGRLARYTAPRWTQYRFNFTTPPSLTSLTLTMTDTEPGGCGNDFALDDITFRECLKPVPVKTARPPKVVAAEQLPKITKPVPQKKTPSPGPGVIKKQAPDGQIVKRQKDQVLRTTPVIKQKPAGFPAPPTALTTRKNPLVKQILAEAGEIRIDLYDNGQIDGDTVSIYHNNALLVSGARLSQQPISMRISIDAAHPHHELVMVADNLGSIPPNTSLMIVTAGAKRYKVLISSTGQKNAKVVFDLNE